MRPHDRETLDRLVAEHHAPMLRLATRLTGRLETAEEIIQEALLRATRGWSSFRCQSGFKTWVTRIILNVFHDWLARQRESVPLEDVADSRHADPPSCAMAEELGRYIAERVCPRMPPDSGKC